MDFNLHLPGNPGTFCQLNHRDLLTNNDTLLFLSFPGSFKFPRHPCRDKKSWQKYKLFPGFHDQTRTSFMRVMNIHTI